MYILIFSVVFVMILFFVYIRGKTKGKEEEVFKNIINKEIKNVKYKEIKKNYIKSNSDLSDKLQNGKF